MTLLWYFMLFFFIYFLKGHDLKLAFYQAVLACVVYYKYENYMKSIFGEKGNDSGVKSLLVNLKTCN